jgi:hypothetical protein
MSVLNLFPSRIRFVNDDGTLTPEAMRMFQVLTERAGGVLGDAGNDQYPIYITEPPQSEVLGQSVQTEYEDAPGEMSMPPAPYEQQPDMIIQPITYSAGVGLALAGTEFSLKDTLVVPGIYGTADKVGQFTVDQQGRLILAANVPIQIAPSQIVGGANFTGSFTGKTVTVTNGIITSVV